jgi:hypothetical protein
MKTLLFISLFVAGCASKTSREERAMACAKGAVIGIEVLHDHGLTTKASSYEEKRQIASQIATRCVESNL